MFAWLIAYKLRLEDLLVGTTIRYFGIACWLVLASTAHALVGGAEPAKNDTRFDAVAAFGETANLLTGHNTFGNGTLITPTKMLMARHIIGQWGVGNQPPSGFYSFRFRRNVDGTIGELG